MPYNFKQNAKSPAAKHPSSLDFSISFWYSASETAGFLLRILGLHLPLPAEAEIQNVVSPMTPLALTVRTESHKKGNELFLRVAGVLVGNLSHHKPRVHR